MSKILKEAKSEHFIIEYFTVTDEDVRRCQLIDAIHGRREYADFKAGEYVRLVRKGDHDPMISDTAMEKETNLDFYEEAHGDVLIAGLGIGMVLLAVQNKSNVTSVTVVEKEQEIIDLVKPQLPLNKKVTIVHGDIFDYIPTQKFDTIYFDIWDNICGDNWEEMKKLHRKFRSKLKPNGWMSSWRKEDCQYATKA